MKSKENVVLKNISWATFDKILFLAISFIISVVLSRYLGPEQNGNYSYIIAFNSLFSAFATLGLERIIVKELSTEKTYTQEDILGTGIALQVFGSGFVFALSIMVTSIVGVTKYIRVLCIVMSLSYVFQALSPFRYWYQAKYKINKIVKIDFICKFSFLIVRLIGIFYRLDVAGFILIYLAETACQYVLIFYRFYFDHSKVFVPTFNKKLAKFMIKSSWPLILGTLSSTIYMRMDQMMIEGYLGAYQLGIYSVAVKIAELWYFIPDAIGMSLLPLFSQLRDKKEIFEQYQKYFDVVTIISYIMSIGIFVFGKYFIVLAYGNEYKEAAKILAVHIWSGIFMSQAVVRSVYFIVSGKTYLSLIVTSMGAVTNIFLNIVMIPRFGGIGAAIGTFISQVLYGYISSFLIKDLRGFAKQQTISILTFGRIRLWVKRLRIYKSLR